MSHYILLIFNQNPLVSQLAYQYIRVFSIAVIIYAYNDIQRKFLIQVG
jgi:Na+-driven multidrug efflux pump